MANLRLTFACGPFDRTQALRDGTIRPEGIDLVYAAGGNLLANAAVQ
jgi:4,5-dihydroxyphthalate decarboxylase